MHDHRGGFLNLFSHRLHHLSRERWREIFRIYGMDRGYLLSDIGFARSACLCDTASGDYYPYAGFSPQMGSPQTDRALDDPDLALCLGHRRARIFDALQVVSAGGVTRNLALSH